MLCYLTNHAQQARGASYREAEHTSTLQDALGEAAAATVMVEVRRVAAQLFGAFAKGSAAFFPLPNCFEVGRLRAHPSEEQRSTDQPAADVIPTAQIFGLDFCLDPQLKARRSAAPTAG